MFPHSKKNKGNVFYGKDSGGGQRTVVLVSTLQPIRSGTSPFSVLFVPDPLELGME